MKTNAPSGQVKLAAAVVAAGVMIMRFIARRAFQPSVKRVTRQWLSEHTYTEGQGGSEP